MLLDIAKRARFTGRALLIAPLLAATLTVARADTAPVDFTTPQFFGDYHVSHLFGCISFTNTAHVAATSIHFSIDFRSPNGTSLRHQEHAIDGNFAPGLTIAAPTNPNRDGMTKNCWEYLAPREQSGLDMRVVRVDYADGTYWPSDSPSPAPSPAP